MDLHLPRQTHGPRQLPLQSTSRKLPTACNNRDKHTGAFRAESCICVQVRVVASLPCYSAATVDRQRGRGVFERSIHGLQLLNAAGYGRPDSGLDLDLVYNAGGPFLAPPQAKLEALYKQVQASAWILVRFTRKRWIA